MLAASLRWPPLPQPERRGDLHAFLPRIEAELCRPIGSGQTARRGLEPWVLPSVERCVAALASLAPASELREAVRDELVPWLLGARDPLAERCAQRRGAERRPEGRDRQGLGLPLLRRPALDARPPPERGQRAAPIAEPLPLARLSALGTSFSKAPPNSAGVFAHPPQRQRAGQQGRM